MLLLRSVLDIPAGLLRPVVVAVGTFDGVHLGHRSLIKRLSELSCGGTSLLVVFEFPPASFTNNVVVPLVIPIEQRLKELETLGVKIIVLIRFDRDIAMLSCVEFLEMLGVVDHIVVGEGSRIGCDRVSLGDCDAVNVPVDVVPSMVVDGERVSSSCIREAISDGDLKKAKQMLGRNYALEVDLCEDGSATIGFDYPLAILPKSTFSGLVNGEIGAIVDYSGETFGGYTRVVLEVVTDKKICAHGLCSVEIF